MQYSLYWHSMIRKPTIQVQIVRITGSVSQRTKITRDLSLFRSSTLYTRMGALMHYEVLIDTYLVPGI